MLTRRGVSLIELLVALTLAGVVLGSATTSLLRQQRTHTRVAAVSASDAQLRGAIAVLGSQLSLLDPAAGDLTAGEADDTVVQFRAPIAASLACDRSVGAVTLLPSAGGSAAITGEASPPHSGDSLWWLGDSLWSGARISTVVTVAANCSAPISLAGNARRVTVAGAGDTIPQGAPIRVTRQTRYGVYRASDGSWQLGFREWNDAAGSFAAPQPVAGPLLRYASGRRSGFRYFDGAGQELAPANGAMDTRRVARIRITTHSLVAARERGQDSVRTDSIDVALLRNARGP